MAPDPENTILVVGPAPSLCGGMSTVVAQHLNLPADPYRVCFLPYTFRPDSSERWGAKVLRHLLQSVRLIREIAARRVGIVHLHTCSGPSFWRTALDLAVARVLGCRVILHIHGAAFDQFLARQRILGFLVRRALTSADAVIALSRHWGQHIQSFAPSACVRVIENAVDVPRKVPGPSDRDRCHFLILAKMDVWKGIHEALAACAKLVRQEVQIHLTLAGPEGSAGTTAQLRQKINQLGLSEVVAYIGPVTSEECSVLFNHCDVLLQPSHQEGMPLAVLEAMAHGRPVVATKVGSLPEIIAEGEQGFLVAPRDANALAQAMERICKDPALRRQMGSRARRLSEERFRVSRFYAELKALYDDLKASDPRHERHKAALSPQTVAL